MQMIVLLYLVDNPKYVLSFYWSRWVALPVKKSRGTTHKYGPNRRRFMLHPCFRLKKPHG